MKILFLQDPRKLGLQAELLECKDGCRNERARRGPRRLAGEDQRHHTEDKQHRKHSEEVNAGHWDWQEDSGMSHGFRAQNVVDASVRPGAGSRASWLGVNITGSHQSSLSPSQWFLLHTSYLKLSYLPRGCTQVPSGCALSLSFNLFFIIFTYVCTCIWVQACNVSTSAQEARSVISPGV